MVAPASCLLAFAGSPRAGSCQRRPIPVLAHGVRASVTNRVAARVAVAA